jgi:hypothetical protein
MAKGAYLLRTARRLCDRSTQGKPARVGWPYWWSTMQVRVRVMPSKT